MCIGGPYRADREKNGKQYNMAQFSVSLGALPRDCMYDGIAESTQNPGRFAILPGALERIPHPQHRPLVFLWRGVAIQV